MIDKISFVFFCYVIVMRKFFIPIFIFLLLGACAFAKAQDSRAKAFDIAKNLDVYVQVFQKLNSAYVDDIQVGELNTTAIEAMLASLDPYTVFLPEAQIDKYQLLQTGQFAGLGIRSFYNINCVVVSDVLENSPAKEAGLLVGDSIFVVDTHKISKYDEEEVSLLLKGQAGTQAHLCVKRYGSPDTLRLQVDRRNIKVQQVPYFGMLQDSIAYLKLNAFSKNSAQEVRKAFNTLYNQGAKALVFDLRGNGGGLLLEAVQMLNIFVPAGKEVVRMKGRSPDKNHVFTTTQKAIDANLPLVFLVDKRSASAAEILSGAAQDLDRAVIIGESTFGKGLVQNILPLSYGAQIKITTAKYYIPSGRCVQAIDYSHNTKASKKVTDNNTVFYTKAGRKVFEGAGVKPDIEIGEDMHLSPLSKYLKDSMYVFQYVTHFVQEHDSVAAPETFELSDMVWQDFKNFLQTKNCVYTSELANSLAELKAAVISSDAQVSDYDFSAIETLIDAQRQQLWQDSEADIKNLLKQEICRRYYYETGALKARLPHDPLVIKAIEIIKNKKAYQAILSPLQ